VGTKNSCLEGFCLAEHTDTNILTMMELLAPPLTWFDGGTYLNPGSLCGWDWLRLPLKGVVLNN